MPKPESNRSPRKSGSRSAGRNPRKGRNDDRTPRGKRDESPSRRPGSTPPARRRKSTDDSTPVARRRKSTNDSTPVARRRRSTDGSTPVPHRRKSTDGGAPIPPRGKSTRPAPRRKTAPPTRPAKTDDKIRLNKYIATSGVSSRREADELIKMGLISVNGKVVTELGFKVNPGDVVRYESRVLRAEKPVYILLNKPKGYITTTDDPQERKTVMQLIGPKVRERIYPVGRLDRNTTGLLLLTNDGDLADRLMHPSFDVKKIYKVELDKPLTRADYQKIVEGVQLEEGRAVVDDLAIVSDDNRTVGIELHIGWNRVVRRIFEALGYEVLKLDRTTYAGLTKKDLKRGQWRFLTREEIIRLKHFK